VLLSVTGPGGTGTRRRTVVVRPAPVFADGSFEAQVPGTAPAAPWTVYSGSAVFVRTSPAGDLGFPSLGANWCEIGAEGSSNARPPSNPLGQGTPAVGAAGVQQDFLFPEQTHLFFEASFLLAESQDNSARNDFMSVDLTDGVTTWNLFHADSFSEFPARSSRLGLWMTAAERVHVDLTRLFPGALPTTVLSLRASVGNVGGGGTPSRGYVDGFRFALSAKANFRNGRGSNPPFYTAPPPVIGATWEPEIDPSALPGAERVLILGTTRPLGGLRASAAGEVLVGGERVFALSFPCSGERERYSVPIPLSAALLGRSVSTQAILIGREFRLGNAYDLVLGY
jgi:hypothetical protein